MTGYIARAEKFMTLLADTADLNEDEKQSVIDNYWTHWTAVCKYAAEHERIHMEARKEAGLINEKGPSTHKGKQPKWYFVTIRPNKHSFEEFKERIESRLLKRKIILDIKYCYEQKGMTDDTLGTGHHMHAIILSNQQSPGNLARELLSTMNGFCGSSGVKVQTSHNPEEHFERYCMNHGSEDGHKELTKEWDKKWRMIKGLQEVYVSPKPSTVGDNIETNRGPEQVVINHNPVLLDLS